MENPILKKTINEVESENSQLKQILIDYVGNKINPESDEINIEQVIGIFSEEFPEIILAIAEENWINGYTQALKDVDYTNSRSKKDEEILTNPPEED